MYQDEQWAAGISEGLESPQSSSAGGTAREKWGGWWWWEEGGILTGAHDACGECGVAWRIDGTSRALVLYSEQQKSLALVYASVKRGGGGEVERGGRGTLACQIPPSPPLAEAAVGLQASLACGNLRGREACLRGRGDGGGTKAGKKMRGWGWGGGSIYFQTEGKSVSFVVCGCEGHMRGVRGMRGGGGVKCRRVGMVGVAGSEGENSLKENAGGGGRGFVLLEGRGEGEGGSGVNERRGKWLKCVRRLLLLLLLPLMLLHEFCFSLIIITIIIFVFFFYLRLPLR